MYNRLPEQNLAHLVLCWAKQLVLLAVQWLQPQGRQAYPAICSLLLVQRVRYCLHSAVDGSDTYGTLLTHVA